MTCAHRTLPLGSVVKVTNVASGKEVALAVNDRGPYVKGRIVDLSERAARELGVEDQGVMTVRLEVISQSTSQANQPLRGVRRPLASAPKPRCPGRCACKPVAPTGPPLPYCRSSTVRRADR
jgi:rare lipoprotein A (peptidoglycan hydrolase)